MRKSVLFGLTGALLLGLIGAIAVSSASAVTVPSQVKLTPDRTYVPGHEPRPIKLAAGYCNAYGCYGNICYTPNFWCQQINYSPVGGPCTCSTNYGVVAGTTGS